MGHEALLGALLACALREGGLLEHRLGGCCCMGQRRQQQQQGLMPAPAAPVPPAHRAAGAANDGAQVGHLQVVAGLGGLGL